MRTSFVRGWSFDKGVIVGIEWKKEWSAMELEHTTKVQSMCQICRWRSSGMGLYLRRASFRQATSQIGYA